MLWWIKDMHESNFQKELRAGLRPYGAFITRIENTASSGVPDLFIAFMGVAFFVELKILRGPSVYFLPQQIGWALKCKASDIPMPQILVRGEDEIILARFPDKLMEIASPGKKATRFKLSDLDIQETYDAPFDFLTMLNDLRTGGRRR